MRGAELRDRALAVSRALRREGVRAGEAVLLPGLAGVSFVAAILGVWECGAAALAADPLSTRAEVEAIRKRFSPVAALLRDPRGDLRAERLRPASRAGLPRGTAVVKLTSGSSGRPRGVAVSADQMLEDGRRIVRGMRITPEDACVGAIPVSHSYGMGNLLMPLVLQGSPILLVPSPLPEILARALAAPFPMVFPGVPVLYDALIRMEPPRLRPSGLRTCLSAGAPLSRSTAAVFRRIVGIPIRAFYGTSETGGIAYDASPSGRAAERSAGCVGTPLPGVEISLRGRERRILVRSSSVALRYVGSPETSSAGRFVSGGFLTGDAGRWDRHGRLCLAGRLDARVNVSGRKVDPLEVEKALRECPAVADAAVLGVPDASRGEALAACVVGRGDPSREEILAHLRARLAAYKIPRRLRFLREIPRSGRGKPDRDALRRAVGARSARG